MNRKITIVVIVAILVLGLGAYAVYDDIFPKTETIEQLEISMLESIKLYDNENTEIVIREEELQKLIAVINGAVATRIKFGDSISWRHTRKLIAFRGCTALLWRSSGVSPK